MRIESGALKGRSLLGQKDGLRPTTSKVKTALFNILKPRIVGSFFVDCFAGTGAVGFEALSLGAQKVGFVELNKQAISYLHKNAERLGVQDRITIRQTNVIQYLAQAKDEWDILFFSPPYDTIHWYQLLRSIEQSPMMTPGTLAIIQHPRQILLDTSILHLSDKRQYGFNVLSFFSRVQEPVL